VSKSKNRFGQWGENLAGDFLSGQDYEILERNYRTEHGEVDLIAQKGKTIVFVEVKTRSSDSFGFPEEAVTEIKQAHMIAAATNYLAEHPEHDGDWRIDVIAIRKRHAGEIAEIKHFENAIQD
jgi:putative endonuclease